MSCIGLNLHWNIVTNWTKMRSMLFSSNVVFDYFYARVPYCECKLSCFNTFDSWKMAWMPTWCIKAKMYPFILYKFTVTWLNRRVGWLIVDNWTKRHFIWIELQKSIKNQSDWMKSFFDPWYRMSNRKNSTECYRYSVAFDWRKTRLF